MKNYRDSEILSGGDVLDKIVKKFVSLCTEYAEGEESILYYEMLEEKNVPFCYGVFSCQD